MIKEDNYSCMNELGAEFLIVITSIIIMIVVVVRSLCTAFRVRKGNRIISDQDASLLVDLAQGRLLSIISYVTVQWEKHNQEVAQVIFIWMVLIEIIRVRNDNYSTWEQKKSILQLIQLLWVSYHVYSHTPRQSIMTSLFVMCVFFIVFEVLNGIAFHKAKNSYLIGKNPKLIQNYLENKMLNNDLHTTPMNTCNYIIMGEENHRIVNTRNGYLLEDATQEGLLTIGRAFLFNLPHDEAFASALPYFHDTCLSFSLAKMLMGRFTNLPVNQARSEVAICFVKDGLFIYIGRNRDIQQNQERNPERVFSIIQEEMNFVSDFLHIKVPIYHYFGWYSVVDRIGVIIAIGNGFYLLYVITFESSTWKSIVAQEAYNHCVFHWIRRGSVVVKFIPYLHLGITLFLVLAFMSIQFPLSSMVFPRKRWSNLKSVEICIRNNARGNRSFANCMMNVLPNEEARIYSSIFDVSILTLLPYWIRRKVPRSSPIVALDAKEAILNYFENSIPENNNGQTLLGNYHTTTGETILLRGSTEAILVWNIATSLIHYQEHPPEQNSNPFVDQEVALALSSYCLYLVAYLPEIIPEDVEWAKKMYVSATKEIFAIPQNEDRRNFVLQSTWGPMSVVGKGARLATILMSPEQETPVWMVLAKFWEEMMLFLAATSNVEAQKKILDREELITQLWALLTHASILTWPQPTWSNHLEH